MQDVSQSLMSVLMGVTWLGIPVLSKKPYGWQVWLFYAVALAGVTWVLAGMVVSLPVLLPISHDAAFAIHLASFAFLLWAVVITVRSSRKTDPQPPHVDGA